jgi:hypothetical protein
VFHHRLITTAASIAAGVILIPCAAQAATTSPAATAKSTGTSATGKINTSFQTFTSPAAKSALVHKALSGTAVPAAANPTLAVALSAEQTSTHGVALTSNITSATSALSISIAWGDGTTDTTTATGSESLTSKHAYAQPGDYTISVTVTDASTNSVSNSVEFITAGSDYTAYGPIRLLDTRNATGAPKAPLTSASPIKLQIAGNGKIPSYVTAVVLNLTVTNTTGYGAVLAYPDGIAAPNTSNLNYAAGQTVPNLAIVPVGADGLIDLAKLGPGSVDMIADVEGFFTQTATAGYTSEAPTRILDTRNATGAPKQPLTSTSPIKLQVAGKGGVPNGVSAVALNLTLTDSSGGGNVTAYPDGTATPTASNLNYAAGQTVANAAIVPVGKDGYIDLTKQGPGSVNMIADVEGYYTSTGASAYIPVVPSRPFDSRQIANGKLAGGFYYPLAIDQDSNNNPLPGVTSIVLNTTVTNVTGTGFLTVFPDNANGANGAALVPNASNLNFASGQTVPNLTFATPGSNGVVDFYNGSSASSSLDLIVDIFGFYANN